MEEKDHVTFVVLGCAVDMVGKTLVEVVMALLDLQERGTFVGPIQTMKALVRNLSFPGYYEAFITINEVSNNKRLRLSYFAYSRARL